MINLKRILRLDRVLLKWSIYSFKTAHENGIGIYLSDPAPFSYANVRERKHHDATRCDATNPARISAKQVLRLYVLIRVLSFSPSGVLVIENSSDGSYAGVTGE